VINACVLKDGTLRIVADQRCARKGETSDLEHQGPQGEQESRESRASRARKGCRANRERPGKMVRWGRRPGLLDLNGTASKMRQKTSTGTASGMPLTARAAGDQGIQGEQAIRIGRLDGADGADGRPAGT